MNLPASRKPRKISAQLRENLTMRIDYKILPELNSLILSCPTGEIRNALTDINISLMQISDRIKTGVGETGDLLK